jgi:hypothetical protein
MKPKLSVIARKDFYNEDFGEVWWLIDCVNGIERLAEWSSNYPTTVRFSRMELAAERLIEREREPE